MISGPFPLIYKIIVLGVIGLLLYQLSQVELDMEDDRPDSIGIMFWGLWIERTISISENNGRNFDGYHNTNRTIDRIVYLYTEMVKNDL